MTTTNTYNPIFRAFRELTSAQAFRWYLQQLQTTVALAQRLLNARKSVAKPQHQEYAPAEMEPGNAKVMQQNEQLETFEGDCSKHFPGLRIANTPEEQLELNQPAMDLLQSWLETDKISVAQPENAMLTPQESAPQQEFAQTEATEVQHLPAPDGWEAIEAEDTAQAPAEQADVGWEAIAPAIEPEPELDDGECDRIANDEPQQAMLTLQESASTELQQSSALRQEYADAEAIELEPDFGEAIADDGGA
jgi:hypothetical protein